MSAALKIQLEPTRPRPRSKVIQSAEAHARVATTQLRADESHQVDRSDAASVDERYRQTNGDVGVRPELSGDSKPSAISGGTPCDPSAEIAGVPECPEAGGSHE